jgi:uncharacterized membrane protein (UPF0127 family)
MSHNKPVSDKGLPPVPGWRAVLPIFIMILLAAVWAGCGKPASSTVAPPPPSSSGYVLPTQAQPPLPTVKIYLGAQTLNAEMAVTPEEEETGLMYRTNITDETAMLFNMHVPQRVSFWMTNCPISLSCAYIGPDGVIEEIHHLEKDDNVPVNSTNNNILYVLEVNDGWFTRHNINPGVLINTERGTLAQTFGQ